MNRVYTVYSLITDANDSHLLMVQNTGSERWTLPGGKVEANETLEAAAIREVCEETGLHVQLRGVVAINEYMKKDCSEHGICVTFRACISSGVEAISRPDEIRQIAWIRLEEADALMPFYEESLQEIVRKNVQVSYYDEGII
ncbi:NUDIX hydrolase [Paenibacillus silvae]|uniref:NUDIX hydrolase n=1 Tax=Paenibacillus silvae TaxID=1325358 RepID=UPI0011A737FC|nr:MULTISPECIES: NUDIX hydrolase [Paenibacillus]MCK6078138.1 NUDIX hydrolase [Paenibacillus silvae]MCK6152480.1 NUDIX hydrolase [Paenibacillus silvae]MCK6271124.1 NUDIX hydrolase [Paenibacillus silvae]